MLLFAMLVCHQAPSMDPSADDIVAKAIAAHGGAEALGKARADKVRLRGTMTLLDKPVPFVGETSVVLPDRLRTVVKVNPGPQETVFTQLVSRNTIGMYINGQSQKVSDGLAATLRETMLMNQAMRLVSLRKGNALTPTLVGSGAVNGRSARILGVSPPGLREIRLWFDNETGLLVKTEHQVGAEPKLVLQEEYYGDFREMGAYRRPAKVVTMRGGKKIMEAELVEVRYPDSIPDSEFLEP
jgi:hypothetical protein